MARFFLFLAVLTALVSVSGCCTVKRGAKCARQGMAEDFCAACSSVDRLDHWIKKNLW